MTAEEQAALAAKEAAAQGESGEGAAGQSGAGKAQVPIQALHDERSKRQALEAKVKQMEAVFGEQIAYDAVGNLIPRGGPAGAPASQPQGQFHQEDARKQLDMLWENDPRRAFQTELSTAITWYDQVSTAVQDQMDALSEKVKDFNQYRPRIQQYLRRLPLDQRGRPGIVEAAYYLQKGQGIDQIIENERKQWSDRMTQAEGIQGFPGGSGGGQQQEAGARRFTAEEFSIAKVYGKTPEEYFGVRKA